MATFSPNSTVIGRASCAKAPRQRINPVLATLVASLLIGLAYGAVERVGTHANVDEIEFTTNIAGGFLAVGFAGDQPGFVLLSQLDREKVNVSADLMNSIAAGSHSRVEIQTSQQLWQARLRAPLVIIVREDGSVVDENVGWDTKEFSKIRTASDCLHAGSGGPKRCGAPFADLHDLVSAGELTNVSEEVRAFLGQYQEE